MTYSPDPFDEEMEPLQPNPYRQCVQPGPAWLLYDEDCCLVPYPEEW